MGTTAIPYGTKGWNPVVGCSAGCGYCWARALHDRRHRAYLAGKKMPPQYAKPFDQVQLFPERLDEPLHWRKPQVVCVGFQGDLFDKAVPDAFIDRMLSKCGWSVRHTYLILTKQAERMRAYSQGLMSLPRQARGVRWARSNGYNVGDDAPGGADWPLLNVWLGVSVESPSQLSRLDDLRATPAALRFVSFEPLLSPPGALDLAGIDWAIVGAASGAGRQYLSNADVRGVVSQCQEQGLRIYVKQLHITEGYSKRGFRVSHDSAEWPEDLRVREIPEGR